MGLGDGPTGALLGVLIGLGAATKLYPLFLLGGLLVICLRDKRIRDFGLATGAAVAAWVVANAPAYVSGKEQWKVFWEFNSDRGADLGSVWLVISQAFGQGDRRLDHQQLVMGDLRPVVPRRAGARPARPGDTETPLSSGFLIVVGFLLVNKVYSHRSTCCGCSARSPHSPGRGGATS